ncbi:hypothetical protein J437_LFUL009337 [Ladona fulva]|uniref:Large ribosomal subunit protein mL37 n=1 Tax=Ladona fulva TaxID=123851 RepID=A0A8K0P0G2_LADFU|nr:hypothetical protein J437_LFUL009337 [Ladona fulva]
MKLTNILFTQHLGRMFKNHWKVQRKRVLVDTGAEKFLKENGIPVYEYEEIINDIPELESKIVEVTEEEIIEDERAHPLWHDRPCFFYKNHSALVEGLAQAKILTKTVEIESGLPKEFQGLLGKFSIENQHDLVKRNIMASHVFDATQVKLPKLHDPERPAWVFPRLYGISDKRRNRLMALKLFNLCQIISASARGVNLTHFVENSEASTSFEKEGDLVQLECRADFLALSKSTLPTYADGTVVAKTMELSLPSIYPAKSTVSLLDENMYQLQEVFPLSSNPFGLNLHTAVIYYNETEVKNQYDLPVTENQFLGRSLVHAFTLAASQARVKYGNDASKLDKPITLQCVHTDGRRFHFLIYQLNTLDLDGNEGIKNIVWMTPLENMFEVCAYQKGKPELVGYNEEVFERLLSFYCN